jgi:hypothetical protein
MRRVYSKLKQRGLEEEEEETRGGGGGGGGGEGGCASLSSSLRNPNIQAHMLNITPYRDILQEMHRLLSFESPKNILKRYTILGLHGRHRATPVSVRHDGGRRGGGNTGKRCVGGVLNDFFQKRSRRSVY